MNDQLNGWFHCLGLLMVQSTFITLVVVDLLLLSHSLIFTVTNLSGLFLFGVFVIKITIK